MKRKGLHFAFLLGCAVVAPAHAQFEVGYAHVDEIDGEISHGFVGSWTRPVERWSKYDIHSEVLLVGILGRDDLPHGDDDAVLLGGVGLRKYFGGFFVGAALGLISKENTFLTSTHQFVSSLGYAHGNWLLGYRHISNANTGGNNDGENLLALSYRF